jgi:RimJ/RimL family protein N-acetyltransferase
MCPMVWKETGNVIGTAGLQPLENTSEIEVGYSIIKEYWGRGIGTEAARGWLEFGFREKRLQRIVAVADLGNDASIRIMKKLGMKFEKSGLHYDLECAFYAISRDRFQELKT